MFFDLVFNYENIMNLSVLQYTLVFTVFLRMTFQNSLLFIRKLFFKLVLGFLPKSELIKRKRLKRQTELSFRSSFKMIDKVSRYKNMDDNIFFEITSVLTIYDDSVY